MGDLRRSEMMSEILRKSSKDDQGYQKDANYRLFLLDEIAKSIGQEAYHHSDVVDYPSLPALVKKLSKNQKLSKKQISGLLKFANLVFLGLNILLLFWAIYVVLWLLKMANSSADKQFTVTCIGLATILAYVAGNRKIK